MEIAPVVVLSVAALVGLQVYLGCRRRRRMAETWREAARRADLDHVSCEIAYFEPMSLTARADTRLVRLDTYGRHKREGALVTVRGTSLLGLRAETLGTAFGKAIGIRELQLGHEGFDRDVHVQGRPEILRAVLDADTRSLVRRLIGSWGASVLDGDVRAELGPETAEGQPEVIASLLRDLVDLAGRLDRPEDIPVRIAENNRREPEWRVRLENLLLLLEQFPQHHASRGALERARSDDHPEVRLRAALASGDQGVATLREIASLGSADDDPRAARAVEALGDKLSREDATEILARALRSRQVLAATACLESLGRVGGSEVVPVLAKVLAVESGDLAVSAARALGASGEPGSEAPLLKALAQGSNEVSAATAEALGRVGSADAVLPLKEAASREGADAALRRAARQAVAEIQSRLHGASPGQLSLAAGDAGQLSLADQDPRGRVSFVKPGTP